MFFVLLNNVSNRKLWTLEGFELGLSEEKAITQTT